MRGEIMMVKRKVITYHSTISNNRLEKALNDNEGYNIETIIPHGNYETLILVEDVKPDYGSTYEPEKQRKIIDTVNLKQNENEALKQYLSFGFEIYKVTTKNVTLVKYEDEAKADE